MMEFKLFEDFNTMTSSLILFDGNKMVEGIIFTDEVKSLPKDQALKQLLDNVSNENYDVFHEFLWNELVKPSVKFGGQLLAKGGKLSAKEFAVMGSNSCLGIKFPPPDPANFDNYKKLKKAINDVGKKSVYSNKAIKKFYSEVLVVQDVVENMPITASVKASSLPGATTIVEHPLDKTKNTIFTTIIDLNDNCGWSREKIADWLESINDPANGVDLRFKPKVKIPKQKGETNGNN